MPLVYYKFASVNIIMTDPIRFGDRRENIAFNDYQNGSNGFRAKSKQIYKNIEPVSGPVRAAMRAG